MTWQDYRAAPATGSLLCRLVELPESGTHSFVLDGFPVLIVRTGETVHAYVNACPHQYLPLDHRGDKVLSPDGKRLLCTNHQAAYDVESGEGVDGPGIGHCLDRIPIEIANGEIRVSSTAPDIEAVWLAWETMQESKEAHFSLLERIEEHRKTTIIPPPKADLERLASLLDAHDRAVKRFTHLSRDLKEQDPEAHRELVARLAGHVLQ